MKKLTDKIGAYLLLFICIVCCKNCTADYLKGADKNVLVQYEKMLNDGTVADAELSATYTVQTLKIRGGTAATNYIFDYTFRVNGNTYTDKYAFSQLPASAVVKLYYLKEDPRIHQFDPQEAIRLEKQKAAPEKLYWGIGWGVVAILLLRGLVKEHRQQPAAETAAA
jgi:hypothetical protein